MIVKTASDRFVVKSEDGSKILGGPYSTKEQAEKRLAQIEWFKAHPRSK